jgi:hypothetical protein
MRIAMAASNVAQLIEQVAFWPTARASVDTSPVVCNLSLSLANRSDALS